jgi:hypothetical protein
MTGCTLNATKGFKKFIRADVPCSRFVKRPVGQYQSFWWTEVWACPDSEKDCDVLRKRRWLGVDGATHKTLIANGIVSERLIDQLDLEVLHYKGCIDRFNAGLDSGEEGK